LPTQKARKPLEIKGLRAVRTQENCHLPCQMDDPEPNEPLSHPARHTGMYKTLLRVEVAGFEPAAFWSRTAPYGALKALILLHLKHFHDIGS